MSDSPDSKESQRDSVPKPRVAPAQPGLSMGNAPTPPQLQRSCASDETGATRSGLNQFYFQFTQGSLLSLSRMHWDHEPGSAGVSPACCAVPRIEPRRRDAGAPRAGSWKAHSAQPWAWRTESLWDSPANQSAAALGQRHWKSSQVESRSRLPRFDRVRPHGCHPHPSS